MAVVYPATGVNSQILNLAKSVYTVSSNDNALVNTIIADVNASSTAEANLLTQQEATMPVNAVFQVVATEEQAIKILNAFQVSSNDSGMAIAEISAAMGLAQFRVDNFKSALAELINSAATGSATQTHGALPKGLGAGTGNTTNMQEYFAELLRVYVNADLESDGFNNLLEAGIVSKIEATVDHVAAAASMHTEMSAGANADKLANLIRQNDERDMDEYYSYIKENPGTNDRANFAPMKGGKTMTFIFDAQLADPSTIKLKYVGTSPAGNGYQTAPDGSKDRVITSASGGTVHADDARIAIVVQMDSKDNYFVRDVSQGDVLESAYAGAVSTPEEFAAAVKAYRGLYLDKDSGFAPVSTFSAYTLTAAPTAAVTKADAMALAYWQAVGQYVAARRANAAVVDIATVAPTIA